jgi:hypothetical protein
MVEIKEAARAAEEFAREALDGELAGLRLEEVELSDDERTWLITLGWVDPFVLTDPVRRLAGGMTGYRTLPRVYKVFQVDRDSGRVRAMKIRDV